MPEATSGKTETWILVEIDPLIGLRFVDLADEIEAMFGVPVELVSRRAIKPRNWKVIERQLIDVP